MRFFKAFSLLHRRTKSETFISGYIPPVQGGFALSNNSNTRPLSLPAGLGSNKTYSTDISSIFDFATARFTPVSANFNHLRGPTASPYRRCTRDPKNTLSSLLVEENMRLRDALNLWFSEYSKTDELLQQCRIELAFERDKIHALQQQTTRDQQLIQDLKKDISRYEKRFENLRDPGPSNDCDRCSREKQISSCLFQSTPANGIPLLPGSSNSATSLVISKQIRTFDEYTSALRMTLSTRRQLRDQKKVSKFWKNVALSTENSQDIVTPSTSAISSVHEPLPPERKNAIDTLMRERGWPYPQAQSAEPKSQVNSAPSESLFKTSLSGDPSLPRIHPVSSIAVTLESRSSDNSVSSRLAPLASESLKAEINLFFGIQKPVKLASSPSDKSTPPKTMGESPSRLGNILKANSLSFSFGSYGELSRRFSNLFSEDHAPCVKLPVTRAKDDFTQNPGPTAGLQQSSLPSSSCLAESSAPSGSSRIFGDALALLQDHRDADMYLNFLPVDKEELDKPLNSGPSWQKHIASAAKQIPSKIGMPRKGF